MSALPDGDLMRRIIGTALFTIAIAIPARAQTSGDAKRTNTPPPAAPAARPRVGTAASPPQPPAPAPVVAPPVYYYPPGVYVVTGAPYVVQSDGSVLADFGNGYERVLRPCAQQSSAGVSQSQQETGRDALGRILPPPGIAALQAGSRGQMTASAPPRDVSACYRTDNNGKPVVVTGR